MSSTLGCSRAVVDLLFSRHGDLFYDPVASTE